MTDIEMVRACAEAAKIKVWNGGSGYLFLYDEEHTRYNPLHDDAQAMALVKKFELALTYCRAGSHPTYWFASPSHIQMESVGGADKDLNRAIVECVAKMVKK